MAEHRIRGLEAVSAALIAFPAELVGPELERALMSGAKPIAAQAERLAPRKTGRLAGDIRTVKTKNPRRFGHDAIVSILVKYTGKDAAPYWRQQEFGNSKMPPQPFMRPAFESMKEIALARVIQSLAAAVPRIAKKVRK